MSYYYFQVDGEAEQLVLDTTAIDLQLPDISREFEKINLFNSTSYISGSGNFRAGDLSFSVRYKKNGSGTAWNSLRYAIARWMGLPKSKSLYFYIVDSSGTIFKTRVYPMSYTGESYQNIAISGSVGYRFMMRDGFYEKQTATTIAATLTGTTLELVSVTNSGLLAVPPLIEFTPTATTSILQVQLAEGYGFKLEGTWAAGTVIQFDCKTAKVYINGNETTGLQSAGSIFSLQPGANTLYVYANEGDFEVSINERYI